jgi:hypothetical protein
MPRESDTGACAGARATTWSKGGKGGDRYGAAIARRIRQADGLRGSPSFAFRLLQNRTIQPPAGGVRLRGRG